MPPLVSTVIPTYNRRDDVVVAVGTAVAQTYTSQEIIVVDDGSTDGTADRLVAEFGAAVRILRTDRLGVSGARNAGMTTAQGTYIALLDSDDEWTPGKLAAQVAYLEARPEFGLVMTDVAQMDRDRRTFAVLRRRDAIPVDGDVVRYVLQQPALVPSSILVRRQVLDDVGMFDTTLPTEEDIDFHLRVAARWKVGVIAEPMTRAMRGHDGLSALSRTYSDYMAVLDRFVEQHPEIAEADRRAGWWAATLRNVRGLFVSGHFRTGAAVVARAVPRARGVGDVVALTRLTAVGAVVAAKRLAR
jgi:glycosyltransferase involved in cell wall biosynthesis